jgi:hypothetical protein
MILQMNKTLHKSSVSRKNIQLLLRKFLKNSNLSTCFLFLIENGRDTCEATHSYISISSAFSTLYIEHVVLHVKIWFIFLFVFYI